MNTNLELALADLATEFAARVERTKKYAEQIAELEESTGLTLVVGHRNLVYNTRLEIKRENLPAVRKVVGRMEMTSKFLPWNFKSTQEVCVEMTPKSEKYNNLCFLYRTKFRPGGKCEIVENVSVCQSLVCKV